MLPRLLVLASIVGLASAAPAPAREEAPTPRPMSPQDPKKPDEPKTPPKGPQDEPKKPEPKKPDDPKKPDPKKPEEPKKPTEEPKGPKDEPKPKEEPKAPAKDGSVAPATPKFTPKKPGALAKYDDVITKEAKTQAGVFAVHRIDDRVYFEIPTDKLGRLMLVRAEVAKGPNGVSFNGQELGRKFVKFERRENKIFVIEANFDKRSGADIQSAVEATNIDPIIASFPVEAEGKDRAAVIAATGIYMNDQLDVGARRATGAGAALDAEKSFLTDVKAFPLNVEARAQLTFRGGGGGSPFGPPGLGAGGPGAARTVLVHYSLYLLPEEPMRGRFFDSRVGYFTENFVDFSAKRSWSEGKEYIARYRLEKKDPAAELSEPVKPIVFYIAPEVPEKFRAAMKKGVEDWQPAFEKAGFKNAIIAKDPPSRAEDPNWDAEDSRYSVIRWVAEPTQNAMGPHVGDPRSGETISSHIIFWHDILKIVHMWYFVQCSAVDARARTFPFPDDLQAELIRYVVAHEVGHTIGLRHNHRASQAYSIKDLRDPAFLLKNGNVASIMSYGRYNYVAQPEDKVPVKDLIPKLGPYDFFAIEWGYKPMKAATPDAEKPALDEMAARQVKEPFLRFGGEDGPSSVDPTVMTENIGADAVKATELGYKNLDRDMEWLLKGTTAKGEDFDTLREAYNAILTHRRLWMGAVLKQVGGVLESRTLGDRGEQFSRVPKDKQKEAVKFIVEHGLTVPKKLVDPAVLNNLKYTGVASDTMTFQGGLIRSLLNAGRLNRLLDGEVFDGEKAYTIGELVADLQAGVWSSLKADVVKIDAFQRNQQRVFIDVLKAEFEPQAGGGAELTIGRGGRITVSEGSGRSMELRAVARMTLKDLLAQIKAAIPKAKDATTKVHLDDLQSDLEAFFDKKK